MLLTLDALNEQEQVEQRMDDKEQEERELLLCYAHMR